MSEVTKITEANCCNLPNLLFQQYCEKVYGINRGVFNTVELSFFDQGNTDIIRRRDGMLRFFQFMIDKLEISRNKSKLGSGVITLILQMSKAVGAKVIVTSRHAEKREKALQLEADLALDSNSDWNEMLYGEKVDYFLCQQEKKLLNV